MLKKKTPLTRFLIWRYKHISNKNFILILSVVVGLTAGLTTIVIKNLTHYITSFFAEGVLSDYHLYLYFAFPIVGLFLVLLVKKFILREEVGHGIPMALFAVSKKNGKMKRSKMFSSVLTAPLTVGFGGSVGLEGPAVATGAAFGSNIANLFHMNSQMRKLLLVSAAAASLSAIFKAPIAAILFAIEVFNLDLTLTSLLPLLLASASAVVTRILLIGEQYIIDFHNVNTFDIGNILFYVTLGIIAGFVSLYFSKMFFLSEDYMDKVKNSYHKLLIGGIALGVLLFAIPPLYGEGYEFMNSLISHDYVEAFGNSFFVGSLGNPWIVILLIAGLILIKPIATGITFGAGGVGGVFAPVLFLGSITGTFFVDVCKQLGYDLPASNFTMIGMAGLMAGVLQAPMTAIFLIAEVTGGYQLFIPLMITTAISFIISRRYMDYNVYTKDLVKKNALITHDKDQAVLTLLKLDRIIEHNFIPLHPEMTLSEMLLEGVQKSKRNLFPVLDKDEKLVGVITLDDVREIMFKTEMHDSVLVKSLMHDPPEYIIYGEDHMQDVMDKFQSSSAWNLPVIKDGKYLGFVSKSKMLTAYRRKLITY